MFFPFFSFSWKSSCLIIKAVYRGIIVWNMVEVLQSFIGHGYILQRDTTRPSLATRFAQDTKSVLYEERKQRSIVSWSRKIQRHDKNVTLCAWSYCSHAHILRMILRKKGTMMLQLNITK